MKKFNLEEALAGKPVITGDGRGVTQLTKFDANNEKYNLLGVLDGKIRTWLEDGRFDLYSIDKELDLFMKSEKRSIWVNVYNNGKVVWLGRSYDTKEGALINSYGDACYIKTIEITNEI